MERNFRRVIIIAWKKYVGTQQLQDFPTGDHRKMAWRQQIGDCIIQYNTNKFVTNLTKGRLFGKCILCHPSLDINLPSHLLNISNSNMYVCRTVCSLYRPTDGSLSPCTRKMIRVLGKVVVNTGKGDGYEILVLAKSGVLNTYNKYTNV